ncbi:MAG: hypothetical protein HWE22_10310 [Flavobacteriales bacterium]|nr:hypothetical protein [Flavobacteriales bacterium]
MSEKINQMIPVAMGAIETSGMMKNDRSVPSEYKGYIVSMAASIMRTGLLTTITFYTRASRTDENGSSEEMRKAEDTNLLLRAILTVLKKTNGDNTEIQADETLMKHALQYCVDNYNQGQTISMNDLNRDKLYLLAEEIQDALYALKLALRTFDLKKSEA